MFLLYIVKSSMALLVHLSLSANGYACAIILMFMFQYTYLMLQHLCVKNWEVIDDDIEPARESAREHGVSQKCKKSSLKCCTSHNLVIMSF